MKKAILLLLFVLIYTNSQAQKDFQGMAVYESKTSMADFKVRMEGNKNINPETSRKIKETGAIYKKLLKDKLCIIIVRVQQTHFYMKNKA